jgi:molybdate transport system substrate-binding protein
MLKLLSSMAPREVLAEAAGLYTQRHAVRISAVAAGGVDVARRIEAGEAVDIVVLASDAIGRLVATGHLLANGRVDLMTCGIAIAVRSGELYPDVTDEAAVRRAVLNAASLSYSTGPSGTYLERLFERWGIHSAVRKRIVVPPPGVPVARLISSGDVQLGFQQLSELINAPGIDVVGQMPASVQLTTTFSGAMSSACEDPITAQHFIEFVASSETDEIKGRYGMSTALR